MVRVMKGVPALLWNYLREQIISRRMCKAYRFTQSVLDTAG